MSEENKCTICGEPMTAGEEMFKFHGYSGNCPKPPLLQPHEMRVVSEKLELDEKRTKLSAFFDTALFANIDDDERRRLLQQADAMQVYSQILGERIAAF